MRKWFIRILWGGLTLGTITLVIVFWAIFNGMIGYMPEIEDLQNPISSSASQVFSADGKLMGTISGGQDNRVMVDLSEISISVVEALIATEDVRFYNHSGIDFKALGRAIVKRGLLRQKNAGGGSTITQQLAKQVWSEKAGSTLERLLQKPIEWAIAVKLERNYTKEEILEMYLNKFTFNYNAVGINMASLTYFSKDPKDLTVTEAALLVGMFKAPSQYNPVTHPEEALERRNVVLEQMYKANYLTEEQLDSCMEQPLGLKFHMMDHNEGEATYFREFLKRYMTANKPVRENYKGAHAERDYTLDMLAWNEDPLYGWCNKNQLTQENGHKRPYNINTDGLKIYTTIDSRMQSYAEKACLRHLGKDLQPVFNQENKGNPNRPYNRSLSKDVAKRKLEAAMRETDRYKTMKKENVDEKDIIKSFNTPVRMELFTYAGVKDTTMTPLDSLRHMKSLLRTGFMAMDPSTGRVKAYVGGPDFTYFKFDMVTKGRRQVGSTIKPFLYSYAVSPSGGNMTPCTLVPNKDSVYTDRYGQTWHPHNGSRAREGEMVPLEWGLQQSNNWVAAYLISELGPKNLKQTLNEFGIRNTEIDATLSLCLGTCDVTVAEMVSAYSAFANHGQRAMPIYVTKIQDSNGKTIAEFRPKKHDVLSTETAYRMLYMLRKVVDGGTGSRLRGRYQVNSQMGGKTGTTNDNKDGWFMAVTPKLVAGCWVGGDEADIHFNTTANGQGANAALPIFAYFIKSVYADGTLPYKESDTFDIPYGFNPCPNEDDDDEMVEVDIFGNVIGGSDNDNDDFEIIE